jgi:alpha/beta superfamily hydrolase
MPFRLPRDATLVRFPAADGVSLEGRLTLGGRDRAVVLCHPHPLYGGSMLTPVTLTAEEAFRGAGYTTLAFNFRGVGGSGGTHDEGRAEVGDVRGALAFLDDTLGEGLVVRAIAGYSFGSWVGGRAAAAEPRVGRFLGIAPVVSRYDYGDLRGLAACVALIAGRHDPYGDPARLEALVAGLPARPWLRVLDADHFFVDALDELADACRAALAWFDDTSSPPS